MTTNDIGILIHALGLDATHKKPWRNHYVTDPTNEKVVTLVDVGLMIEVRKPGFLSKNSHVYMVTEEGQAVAIAENKRLHPTRTRNQKRYDIYIEISDVCDISFGEFLKRRMYNRETL